MKGIKKIISLIVVATMVLSLAACGKKEETTTEETVTDTSAATDTEEDATEPEAVTIDTSEQVDLVFYVMGDAPKDELVVEEAVNKILLEKVNATVDFQFSTWTDWSQKYSLELTSGAADMIYIANWINYATLANSGAFLELDELLPTYAPEIAANVDASLLDQCRVGGSLYAIPATWAEYTSNGIKYREDLRVKYDLPIPNTLENLEAYLTGIQANEPEQGLLTVTAEESTGLQVAFDAANVFNMKYDWVTNNAMPYGLAANYNTPSEVYDYWYSEDFVNDMKLMKKWADLGFWSRSALSDTNDSESYVNGLCVAEVAGQNPNKQITAVAKFEEDHTEWKSTFIAYGEITGSLYPGHATQNGTAVLRDSKNPERALMVLNLLLSDQSLNNLVQAGISGTHYELDAEGNYAKLDGTENFPYEGFNTWNLRAEEYKIPQTTDLLLNEMFDRYEAIANQTTYPKVNIYAGFSENYEDYTTERNAVSDVMRQYLAPIQAGLVEDVDASIAEFLEKAEAAGLTTCKDAFKEQWAAYCEEYGYNK
ncbi:MAG: DUF3502 domain-containing protein [Mobilitalea sp.]